MNKDTRKRLNELLQAQLICQEIIPNSSREISIKIDNVVLALDEFLYNLGDRKVPYKTAVEIWKKYNCEGSWSINSLKERYNLSANIVTQIVKGKYW